MTRPGEGYVSTWLRAETPEQLRMLERLRSRVMRKLDQGDRAAALADKTAKNPDEVGQLDITPDRDLCRVIERYQAGYTLLITEEREQRKLALLARLKGQGTLITDEEYETGMRELGLDAVATLSEGDLTAALARRGLKLPTPSGEGDSE